MKKITGGYFGRLLRINLSSKTYITEDIPEQLLIDYIGGRGLAGHFLKKHITRNWDDPDMPLIFFTGPLVNTRSPVSGRMTIMSRSPLTGTICDSSAGGSFGTSLKKAGIDGIIITGKSDDLCGIEIINNQIHFTDASHLAGHKIGYVSNRIFKKGSTAIIGPAAENGVLFSSIMLDRYFAAGRGGLGLVMAEKNIKYITVKGRELLESADLVMHTGSLVNPDVLDYVNCETIDSHGMKLGEMVDVLSENVGAGKKVVRLHSGDPSLYGAIIEQIDALQKKDIDVEIIPGVTSLFASAATLKKQLTLNGITETLIITRPSGVTLEKDSLPELSRHNATMAIYLGTHKLREITGKVAYPPDTPAAVVYHASWDDEKVVLGTVGDIADKVETLGINRSAMIIIGNVLEPSDFKRSHLYG